MPRLWVVTDQHPNATGVFYKAYLKRLLDEAASERHNLGVKLCFQDLRTFDFPERFVEEVAGMLRAFIPSEDRILVIWDSEEGTYKSTRDLGLELVTRLASRMGLPHEHIQITVIEPMTECLYLLDGHCSDALAVWIDQHQVRTGRRSKPSVGVRDRVHRMAARRQHAPRDNSVSMPSKKDLYDLIGDGSKKGDLAAHMARVVSDPGWTPPQQNAFPRLERLRGFLRAWCDSL